MSGVIAATIIGRKRRKAKLEDEDVKNGTGEAMKWDGTAENMLEQSAEYSMTADERRDESPEVTRMNRFDTFSDMLGDDKIANELLLAEDVVERIRYRVTNLAHNKTHYWKLFSFLIVVTIYFMVLMMQRDPSTTYSMESTIVRALFTSDTGTLGDDGYPATQVPGRSAVIEWLDTVVANGIFKDPDCGDGVCDTPQEFKRFGNYGCQADCGMHEDVTPVDVTITGSFNTSVENEGHKWNICSTTLDLCWYEKYQQFSNTSELNPTWTANMSLMDGQWSLKMLDSTSSGGTSASLTGPVLVTNVTSNTSSWVTTELTAWPTCVVGTGLGREDAIHASPTSYYFTVLIDGTLQGMNAISDSDKATIQTDLLSLFNMSDQAGMIYYTVTAPEGSAATGTGTSQGTSQGTGQGGAPGGRRLMGTSVHPHQRRTPAGPASTPSTPESTPSTPASTPSTPASTPSTPASTPSTPASTPSTPATPASSSTGSTTQSGPSGPSGPSGASGPSNSQPTSAPTSQPVYEVTQSVAITSLTSSDYSGALKDCYECAYGVAMSAMTDKCVMKQGFSSIGSSASSARRAGSTVTYVLGTSDSAMATNAKATADSMSGTDFTNAVTAVKQANVGTYAAVSDPTGITPAASTLVQNPTSTPTPAPTQYSFGTMAVFIMVWEANSSAMNVSIASVVDQITNGTVTLSLGGRTLANATTAEILDSPGAAPASSSTSSSSSQSSAPSGGATSGGAPSGGAPSGGAPSGGPGGRRTPWIWVGGRRAMPAMSGASSSNSGASAGTGTTAAAAAVCFSGCANTNIGDGKCDAMCNNYLCEYDGGDCFSGATGDTYSGITNGLTQNLCSPGCFAILLGNDQCDEACDNAACGWDDNDCCQRSYTAATAAAGLGNFNLTSYEGSLWDMPAWPVVFADYRVETLVRPVGITNRLVAGVLIQQTRKPLTTCGVGTLFKPFQDEFRHAKLYNKCQAEEGSDTTPYGVDPIFLATSDMYNPDISESLTDRALYYNFSDAAQVSSTTQIPYGFVYEEIEGVVGYFSFIDINFSQERAAQYVQYLTDGFYLDDGTEKVIVTFVLYNGYHRHFTIVEAKFDFDMGGTVKMDVIMQCFSGTPYQSMSDFTRLILEILFVLSVIYQAYQEVMDAYIIKHKWGSFQPYYCEVWNYLNWLSIAMFLWCFAVWWFSYVPQVNAFMPEIRYNVYNDLSTPANFLHLTDYHQYHELMKMYHKAFAIVTTLNWYMEMNGICCLLQLLRILELLDFQPRLGLVTKTIGHALADLIHFACILFFILGVYLLQSHWLFGSSIPAFSEPLIAFNSVFVMLLGDTDQMLPIQNLYPYAGLLFIYSFIGIVFFVLLNILLAILVEAYMKVVEDSSNTLSVPAELYSMFRSWYRGHPWYLAKYRTRTPANAWVDKFFMNPDELNALFDNEGQQFDENGRVIGWDVPNRTVFEVPGPTAGVKLVAGRRTIMRALAMHPETKDLDPEILTRVACSIPHLYGGKEPDHPTAGDPLKDLIKEALAVIPDTAEERAGEESLSRSLLMESPRDSKKTSAPESAPDYSKADPAASVAGVSPETVATNRYKMQDALGMSHLEMGEYYSETAQYQMPTGIEAMVQSNQESLENKEEVDSASINIAEPSTFAMFEPSSWFAGNPSMECTTAVHIQSRGSDPDETNERHANSPETLKHI